MLEVVEDRGLGLDNHLLRSCYLKRSEKGRRFPPRTVGLWFEEEIIDYFKEAIGAENAEGIRKLLVGSLMRISPSERLEDFHVRTSHLPWTCESPAPTRSRSQRVHFMPRKRTTAISRRPS